MSNTTSNNIANTHPHADPAVVFENGVSHHIEHVGNIKFPGFSDKHRNVSYVFVGNDGQKWERIIGTTVISTTGADLVLWNWGWMTEESAKVREFLVNQYPNATFQYVDVGAVPPWVEVLQSTLREEAEKNRTVLAELTTVLENVAHQLIAAIDAK